VWSLPPKSNPTHHQTLHYTTNTTQHPSYTTSPPPLCGPLDIPYSGHVGRNCGSFRRVCMWKSIAWRVFMWKSIASRVCRSQLQVDRHIYIRIYIYTYMYTYIYICMWVDICKYKYIYTCIDIYIYIYIFIYIYIDIYIDIIYIDIHIQILIYMYVIYM